MVRDSALLDVSVLGLPSYKVGERFEILDRSDTTNWKVHELKSGTVICERNCFSRD